MQRHAAFLDAQADDYDQVLNVNLRGPFFLARAFARHLREQGRGGRIINNSSVHEELPHPNFTAYCASRRTEDADAQHRHRAGAAGHHGEQRGARRGGNADQPRADESAGQARQPAAEHPCRPSRPPARRRRRRCLLASPDAEYITGTTLVVDGGLLWNYSEQ